MESGLAKNIKLMAHIDLNMDPRNHFYRHLAYWTSQRIQCVVYTLEQIKTLAPKIEIEIEGFLQDCEMFEAQYDGIRTLTETHMVLHYLEEKVTEIGDRFPEFWVEIDKMEQNSNQLFQCTLVEYGKTIRKKKLRLLWQEMMKIEW